MTARKKRGIAALVTGSGSILIGLVLMLTGSSPEWLTFVLGVAGAIGNMLGFTFVFPDHE